MPQMRHPRETAASLTRRIGWLYVVVGGAGLIVLLFSARPRGYEVFNEPLNIIALAVLFLALAIIGLVMAVPKPDPKARFRR